MEEQKQNESSVKDINDELTIESMFKVFDSASGEMVDVRELLNLTEADFENNSNLQNILAYMNKKEPLSNKM
jgi:hypothetical protein